MASELVRILQPPKAALHEDFILLIEKKSIPPCPFVLKDLALSADKDWLLALPNRFHLPKKRRRFPRPVVHVSFEVQHVRRRADDIEKSILPHLLRTRNDVSSDWWGMCRARRTILQKRALIRIPEPSGIGLFLSEEERRSFRKPRRSVLSPGIRHYKRPQGLKRQMLDEKVGAVNAYDLKLLGYTGTFKPPGKQDWIPYMNSISRLHAVGGVAEKLADDQHVNKEWLQFTG